MKIGGFQKFSMIDFPGHVSAIVFTRGCMYRCRFCHNPELVDSKQYTELIDENEILEFLENRMHKLDGVVITGGEPLLHNDISEFLFKVRNMGYRIKLGTSGYFPEKLQTLLESGLVDYVAMDVKAPLEDYGNITRVKVINNSSRISKSIDILMNSKIDYEFRTTIVNNLLNESGIMRIVKLIKGSKRYVLQKFRSIKVLDEAMKNETAPSDLELLQIRKMIESNFEEVLIR
ncbi:MAG: anaerobic ribonucleoside-triphosphate reductase activating protein [Candidatus Dojkabacteria bacterium]|nr:anaerobic ribonucleoside-triphosphate reductase activating protein [Candidatus Dojkabacteria bacterium]MDQ7020743.1 anaerobic ribonucleoside-triphosphate reductase activating protein [Candidatus Dojkabacteria bacterium]